MRWITVSDDDYTRVVALRRLAYGGADKLDPMSDAMADAFDSESAILVATEATTVVGSLRLTPFVRGANEYEQLVTLPADFPRPKQWY